jgi:hypothetical protein
LTYLPLATKMMKPATSQPKKKDLERVYTNDQDTGLARVFSAKVGAVP